MIQAEHAIFIPYNKKLTLVARENRKNPTKAEKRMWYEILNRKQFEGYKFSRQKPIDNFIADFYCAQLQLVIEIDGDSHAEKEDYDTFRTEVLQKFGLRIVRYTNDEVLNNVEGVYEDLCNKLIPPTSPY